MLILVAMTPNWKAIFSSLVLIKKRLSLPYSDTDCFDPMPIYNDIIKDADFAITPIDGNHLSHNGHVEDVSAPGPSRSSTTRVSHFLVSLT